MDGADPEIGSGAAGASTAPLSRRLAAELMGAFLLVAVGTGTTTVFLSGQAQRIATLPDFDPTVPGAQQQQDFFMSLLSNSFGDVLPIALAFAFALAVAVYAFGGTSGGHFNPAVTLALAVTRRFDWADVAPYCLMHCLGGIAGAFLVAGIYGESGVAFEGTNILLGATTVAAGVGQWQAILSEALVAFVLTTAIMAIAVDRRAPKGWSGLVIGLALGAGVLVAGAATGASANFARSLGPFVASLVFDPDTIPWSDLIVYAVGPVVGAAAAAYAYEFVSGMERVAPAPAPGAATSPEAVLEIDITPPPPPPPRP